MKGRSSQNLTDKDQMQLLSCFTKFGDMATKWNVWNVDCLDLCAGTVQNIKIMARVVGRQLLLNLGLWCYPLTHYFSPPPMNSTITPYHLHFHAVSVFGGQTVPTQVALPCGCINVDWKFYFCVRWGRWVQGGSNAIFFIFWSRTFSQIFSRFPSAYYEGK